MPDTTATLSFLAKHPKYKQQKPYAVIPAAEKSSAIKETDRTNIEVERHDEVPITDIRHLGANLSLETNGFEVLCHKTKYPILDKLSQCKGYKKETAELLEKHFNAERVVTWDLKKRYVTEYQKGETWDSNDPRQTEGPATMAHADYTFESGLVIVNAYLTADEKLKYLNSNYRIRLVNTWRPMVPVISQQPLALCDSRSVSPNQMIGCDRILCDVLGEVYLMQYHQDQKWYWLENQTPDEPYVILTWDSASKGQARFCPHLSFANDKAPPDAPARKSVETRSIIINRIIQTDET